MMMSKMDTLNETELRGLASMHLQLQLFDECETRDGRGRVRSECLGLPGTGPGLYWRALIAPAHFVGVIEAHRDCARAIVAHWLKASDR